MAGRAVLLVDTAEAQSVVDRVERVEVGEVLGDADVALDPGLPTGRDLGRGRGGGVLGLLPERVETLVEPGDELLFVPQFLG
ncbi:hypothetical protein ACFQ60_32690 [Streptomyces zhihengii]